MEQICGLILFIGPAILAWQTFSWLRTGIWTALPISTTCRYFELPMPTTRWLGLQKIIDWMFDIPTSFAVFALTLVISMILVVMQALFEDYLANRTRK
jgi:hypothetical protein